MLIEWQGYPPAIKLAGPIATGDFHDRYQTEINKLSETRHGYINPSSMNYPISLQFIPTISKNAAGLITHIRFSHSQQSLPQSSSHPQSLSPEPASRPFHIGMVSRE